MTEMVNDMVIGFLPLDTRPCTYDLPVQLAYQAGAQVLLPPQGMMADYKVASDTKGIKRWLIEKATQCDAFVVSVEQLLHGGLIQSRQAQIDAETQLVQLQVLRDVKRENPNLKLLLSNVLMRTSISTTDAQSAVWWKKINLYSKLYYRMKVLGDTQAMERCKALEDEIPSEVLASFFEARRVNHAINRACIQLVADGIVNQLLILQEDCASEGVQRFEQETLQQDIAKLSVADKVFMFNGTDEAGAELLQRAIHPEGRVIEVTWLGAQPDFTAHYEDRPFKENLQGHMAALRMRNEAQAKQILFVLTPKKEQREAFDLRETAQHDYSIDELQGFCKTISECAQAGRQCYLLDLDFSNGGNSVLLQCLAQCMPIKDLCGYAAWNTACNALGTILAQILSNSKGNDNTNQMFTAERILDDAVYQEIVRQTVTKRLETIGEDVYNIKDITSARRCLNEEFDRVQPLLNVIFNGDTPEFHADFRWPRLFEIALFTEKGNGPFSSMRPAHKMVP